MFGAMFGGFAGGSFSAQYRVYPVSFLDKLEAENGDKIFLPPSALDRLASLHIEYPMLFKVENRRNSRSTHCGVLEFIADEGMMYMPYWMMQNLLLEEGDIVTISSATLRKGTYVKLQPHTKDFLDISNPKAVLETTLRGYSCLTKGDCICLHYNNKRYYIDIIEAKPEDAISVIETDCNVDFAPPLDYVEPSRDEYAASAAAAAAAATPPAEDARSTSGEEAAPAPEEPKFLAFVGSGRRLDGKPAAGGDPVPVKFGAFGPRLPVPAPEPGTPGKGTAAPGARPSQKAGKVVFGSGNRLLDKQLAAQGKGPVPAPEAKPPAPKPEDAKLADEANKFHAFSGRPRSLRD
ncbi:hypothetical protein WJX81_000357 [Elliptochloris bilobata]|uniref:Ubiquitin fusion degradaton protein n=1 Tax=Elliptochloris bilobata TaxID=381761 RepID=A0AAW1SHP6_9CHLO